MPYGTPIIMAGRGARNIINAGYDCVIVAMNYRSNAFGFLALNELAEEGSLNLGIRDVELAFRWVREHIFAFGGNPRQVTAFGLSSGGGTHHST